MRNFTNLLLACFSFLLCSNLGLSQQDYFYTNHFVGNAGSVNNGNVYSDSDENGNLFVGAEFLGTPPVPVATSPITSNGANDILMKKYSPAGNLLWQKNFGSVANDSLYQIKYHNNVLYVLASTRASFEIEPGNADAQISYQGSGTMGYVAAFNAQTGAFLWRYVIGKDPGVGDTFFKDIAFIDNTDRILLAFHAKRNDLGNPANSRLFFSQFSFDVAPIVGMRLTPFIIALNASGGYQGKYEMPSSAPGNGAIIETLAATNQAGDRSFYILGTVSSDLLLPENNLIAASNPSNPPAAGLNRVFVAKLSLFSSLFYSWHKVSPMETRSLFTGTALKNQPLKLKAAVEPTSNNLIFGYTFLGQSTQDFATGRIPATQPALPNTAHSFLAKYDGNGNFLTHKFFGTGVLDDMKVKDGNIFFAGLSNQIRENGFGIFPQGGPLMSTPTYLALMDTDFNEKWYQSGTNGNARINVYGNQLILVAELGSTAVQPNLNTTFNIANTNITLLNNEPGQNLLAVYLDVCPNHYNINFTGDTSLCNAVQADITLNSSSPITNYVWYTSPFNNNLAQFFNTQTVDFLYDLNPGQVSLNNSIFAWGADANGCRSSIVEIPVVVNRVPTFLNDNPFSISFCASSSNNSLVVNPANGDTFTQKQWFKDGALISGENNFSITLNNANQSGVYTFQAENYCGVATAAPITATVLDSLKFGGLLQNGIRCNAVGSWTMTAPPVTGGTGVYQYQWFSGANPIFGATGATYSASGGFGNVYYVRVSSGTCEPIFSNTATPEDFSVNNLITQQPQNASACLGETVTLSVGAHPLATGFEWRRNGLPIAVSNNATLVINNFSTQNAGTYSVEVFSACGSRVSNNVQVSVSSGFNASIVYQTPTAICPNSDLVLEATINTGFPLNQIAFQWFKNGVEIPGANGLTFTIANYNETANFRLRATTACGTVLGSTFTVIAEPQGTLNVNITNNFPTSVCPNEPLMLEATVSPAGDYNYQWFQNGVAIAGALGLNHTVSNLTEVASFYLEVSNTCGSAVGSTVTVTPQLQNTLAVTVVNNINATELCPGEPVVLDATVTPAGNYGYQWLRNGSPIAGATTVPFNLTNFSGPANISLRVIEGCTFADGPATLVNELAVLQQNVDQGLIFNITFNGGNAAASSTVGGTIFPASTPSFVADRFGNANNAIQINSGFQYQGVTGLPQGNSAYSTSVWFRVPTQPSTFGWGRGLFTWGMNQNNMANGLHLLLGGGFRVYHWNNDLDIQRPAIFDEWIHVVITYDGSTQIVYQNGVEIGRRTLSAPINVTGSTLAFNQAPFQAATYQIDDFKVYNRAITPNEVNALFTLNESQAANFSSTLTANAPNFCINENLVLTASGSAQTGNPDITYQWLRNGVVLSETGSTLTVNAPLSNATFTSRVLFGCEAVLERNYELNVLNQRPIAIINEPGNQTVCTGDNVVLTVDVAEPNERSFQWNRAGIAIPGATGSTLTLNNIQDNQLGFYGVTITHNTCLNTETVGANVTKTTIINDGTLNNPPYTVTYDISASVCDGEDLNLSATVLAAPAGVSYQWLINGQPIPGATSLNAVIPNFSGNNTIRLVVSAPCFNYLAQPVIRLAQTPVVLSETSTTGLVLRADFNDNRNAVVNGNTVAPTIFNSLPALAPDRFGNPNSAVNFTRQGPNANWLLYNVGDNVLPKQNEPYTVSFWYTHSFQQNLTIQDLGVYEFGVPSNNRANGYIINQNQHTHYNFSNDLVHPRLNMNPNPDNWEQIVCTFDGSTQKIYINGVAVASRTTTINVSGDAFLYLGVALNGSGTRRFNGRLDDFEIYNRAFTAAEVSAKYAFESLPNVSDFVINLQANPVLPCVNESTSIVVETPNYSGVETYRWFKNGVELAGELGSTLNLQAPIEAGTYSVEVTFGCEAINTQTIEIELDNNRPVEIIEQPTGDNVCVNAPYIFSVVSGNLSDTYQWFFNGNSITGATNSSFIINAVTAADAGLYSVEVTNVCGNSVLSNVAQLSVLTTETAITQGLPSTLNLCAGEDLSLSVTAEGIDLSYAWFKNNVLIAGQQSNSILLSSTDVNDSGTFMVEVYGTCGVVSAEILVTVNPIPVVTVEPIEDICVGESITLTATGADSFTWTGDVENGIAFTPSASGVTTYSAVGTSNGCESAAVSVTVTVKPIPVITVEPISAVCLGESVTLTASGADSFAWTGGVTNGVAFTPTQTSDYTVIGTSNGCASLPETVTVVVNQLPTLDITAPEGICGAGEVTISATSNGTLTFSNGVENGIPFNLTETTTFEITSVLNSCEVSETLTIQVNEAPNLQVPADFSICGEGEITLVASGANQITWDNGVLNGEPFVLNVTTTFTATGVNTGCAPVTETVTVTVNEFPTLTISAPEGICGAGEVTISATSNGTLTFSNGVENNVPFTLNETTSFEITSGLNGCEVSETLTIQVNEAPNLQVPADFSICGPSEITLVATGANQITWSGGVQNGVPFILQGSITYQVTGINVGCDPVTAFVNITVNPLPTPTIVYNSALEQLETEVFEDYQWFFNGVFINGANEQTYQTTVDGLYMVVVTDENGCLGESEIFNLITVGVKELSLEVGFNLYPNPASNQVNISYTGSLTERVALTIFDLSGKAVGSAVINQNQQVIDISGLAQGIYLFRIETPTTSQTKRIAVR
ncbi:MAG: LamG-like jellyroll fold domain-containing protein [Luteibaculaceae bacterium]